MKLMDPPRIVTVLRKRRIVVPSGKFMRRAAGAGGVLLAAALLVAPAARAGQAGPASGNAAATSHRGHISGKVTTRSGRPLPGMCVGFRNKSPVRFAVQTNKAGKYVSLELPPGRYTVSFSPTCGTNNGNWLGQFYKNAAAEKNATKVRVTSGHTTPNIDAVMHPGAVVTGTVTNTSGNPIPSIVVSVASVAHPNIAVAQVKTTNKGFFRAERIPSGRYRITFLSGIGNKANYAPQQWNDKTFSQQPTIIHLTAGRVLPHINVTMKRGAVITGTVTEGSSSGTPLGGICVRVDGQGPLAGLEGVGKTNSDGTYFISSLATGKYQVNFNGCLTNPHNIQPETLPGVQLTTGTKTTVNGVLQPAS
jgi:molybdopterin-binding protein